MVLGRFRHCVIEDRDGIIHTANQGSESVRRLSFFLFSEKNAVSEEKIRLVSNTYKFVQLLNSICMFLALRTNLTSNANGAGIVEHRAAAEEGTQRRSVPLSLRLQSAVPQTKTAGTKVSVSVAFQNFTRFYLNLPIEVFLSLVATFAICLPLPHPLRTRMMWTMTT